MKLFKNALAVTAVSALVLAGCSTAEPAADADHSQIVQDAMMKGEEIKSAMFTGSIDANVEVPDQNTEVDMAMDITGMYDFGDLDNPMFSMDMNVDASVPELEDLFIDVSAKLGDSKVFFRLNEVEGLPEEVPAILVAGFLNRWMYLPFEGNEAIESVIAQYQTGEELTPEQEEMKAYWEENDYFVDVEYLGMDSGMANYAVKYNAAAMEEFMTTYQAAVLDQAQITAQQDLDLESVFNDAEIEIWINEEGYVAAMTMDFELVDEMSGGVVDMDMEFEISDINGSFDFEIPSEEEAELFDLFSAMGAAGPGIQAVPVQ